jgi:hypothetical protein
MDHLQSQYLLVKLSVTGTHDSHLTVLALAALGCATQIGFLFLVALPKVAKASTAVPPKVAKASTVLCHYGWDYPAYFRQWKHGLNDAQFGMSL